MANETQTSIDYDALIARAARDVELCRELALLDEGEHVTMLGRMQARREQNYRDLASNLADMVEAGDLTAAEANVWLSEKAEQWFGRDL